MNRRHFLATLAAVLPFGGALGKMMGKREESAYQQEVIERCLRETEEALGIIRSGRSRQVPMAMVDVFEALAAEHPIDVSQLRGEWTIEGGSARGWRVRA